MFCPQCQRDVAAQIAEDGRTLDCGECGVAIRALRRPASDTELDALDPEDEAAVDPPAATTPPPPESRTARELLEKWSAEDAALPDVPAAPAAPKPVARPAAATPAEEPPTLPEPAAETPAAAKSAARLPAEPPQPSAGRVIRADAADAIPAPKMRRRPPARPPREEAGGGGVATAPRSPSVPNSPVRPEMRPPADHRQDEAAVDAAVASLSASAGRTFRVDAAHARPAGDGPAVPPPHKRAAPPMPEGHRLDAAETLAAPHFNTESFVDPSGKRPGRGESLIGQVLAYGGVGLLTVGTTLLLWGYFGGPAGYTPTGWLVATVGQMLLFLGVVTLISGGMQQATHEVTARVSVLDRRLGRIEETTQTALSGPHFLRPKAGTPRDTADRPV